MSCGFTQPEIEAIRKQMAGRGNRLRDLKEQMNGVEDEVFKTFCHEIGVDNIRYFKYYSYIAKHKFHQYIESQLVYKPR